MSARDGADRIAGFTESVIREMTRLADTHGAVNLAQGFPDFPAPDELKAAAIEAIAADRNQYSITWGARDLRAAVAARYRQDGWPELDPESEITITCGSTEAMASAFLALVDRGSEVILFEPFYENYGPDTILAESSVRAVTLHPPDWRFDPDELRVAVTPRTRAIILNTPHNPTGKVFDAEELATIARLCVEHDLLAFTDEIYERITYDGASHRFLALQPGMGQRTVTISALSKTYSVTGWRVGWAIAAPPLTDALRKVHDFLTVAAPTPLQAAGVVALALPESFYGRVRVEYGARRDRMLSALHAAAFDAAPPRGAYYVMADISRHRDGLGLADDVAFCRALAIEHGVATVPGSSFFSHPALGAHLARFAFAKRLDTIDAAGERLLTLGRRLGLAG